jgi:hypothetical protein
MRATAEAAALICPTVSISLSQETFVYVVDGRLRPIDHFVHEPKGVSPLAVPDYADHVTILPRVQEVRQPFQRSE